MSAAEQLSQVMRDKHPDPGTPFARTRYVMELMIRGLFKRGDTSEELAEDWGCALKTTQTYATHASRHLELLGEREHIMQRVRYHADRWMDESGQDRVAAAKLLIETVGGIAQRHEHKHEMVRYSEEELFTMTLDAIKKDPDKLQRALAYLNGNALPPAAIETEAVEVE